MGGVQVGRCCGGQQQATSWHMPMQVGLAQACMYPMSD